jgi:thiamine biosynthesis lipoprotein
MTLSRRDFLKITALAGAAVGMGATVQRFLSNGTGMRKVSETYQLMGTIVNFVLIAESEDQAHAALQQTVDEMRRLIQMYDYRQPESPLGQLNAKGITRHAPAELIATVQQALNFGSLSHGAFDITVQPLFDAMRSGQPLSGEFQKLVDYRSMSINGDDISFARPGMAVTLDGIAKGSVVDGGVAMLQRLSFTNVLVEAGGDMMAKGCPNEDGWKIGIAHPRHPSKTIATISIQDQAVATSGDYMNYFSSDLSAYHIIDPRTGRSPVHLASATVIAPTAAKADALSTTMMVLGVQDGLAMIEQLPGTAALLVTKDMAVYRSSTFPSA